MSRAQAHQAVRSAFRALTPEQQAIVRRFQQIVIEERNRLHADYRLGNQEYIDLYNRAQQYPGVRRSSVLAAQFGRSLQDLVARRIRDDGLLAGHFDYVGDERNWIGNGNPDFVGASEIMNGKRLEATTPGELREHVARQNYADVVYALFHRLNPLDHNLR